MMNKKIATTLVLAFSITYALGSQAINLNSNSSKKRIDLSAFKNFKKNIDHFTYTTVSTESEEVDESRIDYIINSITKDVNQSIIKTKELLISREKKKTAKETIDTVKISYSGISKKTEMPSLYEFKLRDDIEEAKFEAEKIKVSEINLPEIKEETEEVPVEKDLLKEEEKGEDDFVVFNYDKKKTPELSPTVIQAIKREAGDNTKSLETKEDKGEEGSKNIEEEIIYDYSAPKRDFKLPEENKSAFAGNVQTNIVKIRNILLNLGTKKATHGTNFEFEPDFDRNERVSDNGTGELSWVSTTEEKNMSLTGAIIRKESIPSRIDLNLSTHNRVVLSLDEESYYSYIDSIGVKNKTAIIVSVPRFIKDVEIGSSYEVKETWDKNFKNTDDEKQYYIFWGVNPGNVEIKYRGESETVKRLAFVADGEVYFEYPTFKEKEKDTFLMTTQNLLSKRPKELALSKNEIKIMGSEIFGNKRGLNAYEFFYPIKIEGEKNYYQFNHEGNEIYLSKNTDVNAEVPSKDFITTILAKKEIGDLDGRCLIQININKEIGDVKYAGKNVGGEMFVSALYLDQDGKLNETEFEYSDKMFIVGEGQGIINTWISYTDGTVEAVKSYCASGAYLLEQLR